MAVDTQVTAAVAAEPIIYGTKEHPYSTLPETKEDLNWADLVQLDLAKFDEPGGKQQLAKQLRHAAQHVGFFYVINSGFAEEEIDDQFRIARELFDLPTEEKVKHVADHKNGSSYGYIAPVKPLDGPSPTVLEAWNAPRFNPRFVAWHAEHKPAPLAASWDAVAGFGRKVHSHIIDKLLVIFALVLELEDEQYFVKRHEYDDAGDDLFRYVKYKREGEAVRQWIKGHTDLSTVTLLFRQPIAALQILGGDDEWRWVKPHPGSITVNFGDFASLLSGGVFKSSIHRVACPPADQRQLERLGVLYFMRPSGDVVVKTVPNSPVLEREGVYTAEAEAGETEVYTVQEHVSARQAYIASLVRQESYQRLLASNGEEGTEAKELEAVIKGATVKYWN